MLEALINLAWLVAAAALACALAYGGWLTVKFLFLEKGLARALARLALHEFPPRGSLSARYSFSDPSLEV
jgi:hypothetical protein